MQFSISVALQDQNRLMYDEKLNLMTEITNDATEATFYANQSLIDLNSADFCPNTNNSTMCNHVSH